MSAREELRESLLPVDRYPAPGEAEDVDRLLDAYRAEIQQELAEGIRQWADKNQAFFLEGERTGARMAADMIDVFTP